MWVLPWFISTRFNLHCCRNNLRTQLSALWSPSKWRPSAHQLLERFSVLSWRDPPPRIHAVELLFILWLTPQHSPFHAFAHAGSSVWNALHQTTEMASSFKTQSSFFKKEWLEILISTKRFRTWVTMKKGRLESKGERRSRPNKLCYQHVFLKPPWGKAEGMDFEVKYLWVYVLALVYFNLMTLFMLSNLSKTEFSTR